MERGCAIPLGVGVSLAATQSFHVWRNEARVWVGWCCVQWGSIDKVLPGRKVLTVTEATSLFPWRSGVGKIRPMVLLCQHYFDHLQDWHWIRSSEHVHSPSLLQGFPQHSNNLPNKGCPKWHLRHKINLGNFWKRQQCISPFVSMYRTYIFSNKTFDF